MPYAPRTQGKGGMGHPLLPGHACVHVAWVQARAQPPPRNELAELLVVGYSCDHLAVQGVLQVGGGGLAASTCLW